MDTIAAASYTYNANNLKGNESIQSMYGSKPYILGLERCEDYRNAIPQINRLMGPAGLFNCVSAEFDLDSFATMQLISLLFNLFVSTRQPTY